MKTIIEKNITADGADFILRLVRHPRAGLLVLVGQPADPRMMPHATPGEFIRCADFEVTDGALGKSTGMAARNTIVRDAAAALISETPTA